jgi:hypothetical protein
VSENDEYLRGLQKMMRDAWLRQRAGQATAEARFYAGQLRAAYWRGVRPVPGWRASMNTGRPS